MSAALALEASSKHRRTFYQTELGLSTAFEGGSQNFTS
jgi:hypothetical protein